MAKLTRKQITEGLKQIPIETVLLGSTKGRELTKKQKDFARGIALGKPKAQAYRDAYNVTSTNKPATGTTASKLSRHPKIALEIEAYRIAEEASKHRTPERLRELCIHQLTIHALDEDINPAQRIKSLELLGKIAEVGLFEDRKTTTIVHQSGDIKARLMEKLRSVMDIEAKDIYSDGDSLLAELRGDGLTESVPAEPTTPPTADIDGAELESYTHSIPHNRSTDLTVDSSTDNPDSLKSTPQVIDSEQEKSITYNVIGTDPLPHPEFYIDAENLILENTPPNDSEMK
jgi:hypothetical protein